MTAQQLSAVDLLLTVSGTLAFFGAAVLVLSGRGSIGSAIGSLACGVLGALATLGRVPVVVSLTGHGWWFGADKMLLGLPLAVLTGAFAAVLAGPSLVRAAGGRTDERGRRRAAAGLFIAGYGSAAGLLVTFVVGYPVEPIPALVVVLVVGGLAGLTWSGLAEPERRRPLLTAGLVLACVLPALASAGLAFYRNLQPVLIGAAGGHHAGPGPATAGSGDTVSIAADADRPAGDAVSVADLRTPAGSSAAPIRFALTARQQQVSLTSGRVVDGWTFGSLPGPEIRVRQGDLVEVTLTNADIADGVTVHWHGYPMPNGEVGVAGVTQDAVAPGGSFTYRFVARDAGTYWYHAHQVSSEAVRRGLFGVLVVDPVAAPAGTDLVVPVHTFDGIPVIGDTDGVLTAAVGPGEPVRVRLINTDPTPHRISVAGAEVTVASVDGTDLTGPTPISGRVLRIPAGGRYDLTFRMPAGPVAFGLQGAPATGVRLDSAGSTGSAGVPFDDGPDLDLLDYGAPAAVPGFTADEVTREDTIVLDRQFRFLHGIPTFAQTVNGQVHPFVPPIPVREGDLLRLTVANRSGETHPMHPHGHRVLVESRNGEPVRGSPLWLDTFDVQPGEVWTVLLRAENPGIWMSHCHNLNHATQGMVVHLSYEGVSTPFELGGGPAGNRPQ